MSTPTLRIAGAPITWGVCEVPGWGHQMDVDRVLSEMSALGISAMEFGPDGFLPVDPAERAAVLERHGLLAVGGFVPLVLHDPEVDPTEALRGELESYRAAGAGSLVLAAATGVDGYDAQRPVLDDEGWALLLRNLERCRELAASYGVRAVLHPHVGTMVEGPQELARVIEGSDIPLCLDSGHLLIGGTDPVDFAVTHADRIAHVHLKDVDLATSRRVLDGELTYQQAVAQDLYRPLGDGDIDMRSILEALLANGFDGWLVLEQDTILAEAPADGEGPVHAAGRSLEHLNGLLTELGER